MISLLVLYCNLIGVQLIKDILIVIHVNVSTCKWFIIESVGYRHSNH